MYIYEDNVSQNEFRLWKCNSHSVFKQASFLYNKKMFQKLKCKSIKKYDSIYTFIC